MDEVVAIKVIDSNRRPHFFLTWGRSFDAVNPAPLLSAFRGVLAQFGMESFRSIQVCDTLQSVVREPYFFEALLAFSREKVPSGSKYDLWKARCRRRIKAGRDVYYLGRAGSGVSAQDVVPVNPPYRGSVSNAPSSSSSGTSSGTHSRRGR